MNRTLQNRLVNELRAARIRTREAANRYLGQRFLPTFNATFERRPADPAPAFVPVGRVDLEQILCHEEPRTVTRDNTIVLDRVVMQLDKQRGAARARACPSWCAVISTASIPCGGALAVSGGSPPRAARC